MCCVCCVQDSTLGCNGHPTVATHRNMAAVVQQFVANITAWGPSGTETSFLYHN